MRYQRPLNVYRDQLYVLEDIAWSIDHSIVAHVRLEVVILQHVSISVYVCTTVYVTGLVQSLDIGPS
ncbi:hypothetical protein K439DRAFT_1631985 [Ramaria rubella]|nr:hypothetical protein K439DRAFT_1631985 [Ramaria rubella]